MSNYHEPINILFHLYEAHCSDEYIPCVFEDRLMFVRKDYFEQCLLEWQWEAKEATVDR